MNETVEVQFGLSFIQLINVVRNRRPTTPSARILPFPQNSLYHTFPVLERKKSNYDVQRVAAVGKCARGLRTCIMQTHRQ